LRIVLARCVVHKRILAHGAALSTAFLQGCCVFSSVALLRACAIIRTWSSNERCADAEIWANCCGDAMAGCQAQIVHGCHAHTMVDFVAKGGMLCGQAQALDVLA